MVVLVVRVSIQPEQRDRWLAVIRKDAMESRTQAGCEKYHFSEDLEAPNSFLIVEQWASEEAHYDHFRHAQYRDGASRDDAAVSRDRDAALNDSAVGEPITTQQLARFAQSRDAAASDRSRASRDRQAAVGERGEAQHDRVNARDDRQAGAGERAKSQLDRALARWTDRLAGAGERGNAWLDRDTAVADRGAGASERSEAGHDRDTALADRDTALADRDSSAVELEHSSHDALTGAYLRGTGFAELNREIMRARRERQPLVLVFVDVDGLKATNDSTGHAAGDRMLRAVADALRAKLRAHDLVHPLRRRRVHLRRLGAQRGRCRDTAGSRQRHARGAPRARIGDRRPRPAPQRTTRPPTSSRGPTLRSSRASEPLNRRGHSAAVLARGTPSGHE